MKLGIIGAMEIEIQRLKEAIPDVREVRCAGMEFYEGTLENVPVVVSRCGVGKVNAAMCVQVLCDRFSVSHIINTGIAGSLCGELHIGDLVVSVDAMYHDFDCVNFGYPFGVVPGRETAEFAADEQLCAYAFAAAERVNPGHTKVGRVASGDQFVSTQSQKDSIIARTHALCTEMEGAAIAQAATRNEVPFVIIRAISDNADETVQWDYFESTAAERCAEVTRLVVSSLAADDDSVYF